MFIDSHAHLSSSAFNDDEINRIIKDAKDHKVEHIINICTDEDSLKRGLELTQKYPLLKNVGSTTPHDVKNEGASFFDTFQKHALNGDLVAIGETGLDYFYEHSPKEIQQEYLIKYIDLAKRANLPIVIHCRDAFDDFFKIIDKYYGQSSFLIHCFTGTFNDAQRVIERGGMISFSGILTFKKSHELKEIAKAIDLNHCLIETDAPYLAPQEVRGQKNEPKFVPFVAQCLAELKGLSIHDVANITSQNALKFFNIL